jgi:predicted RNA-binding Zn-ribbon protein involved in translation (DUF1610 family)
MTREQGKWKSDESYECDNCGGHDVENRGEEEEGYFTFACYDCGITYQVEIEEDEE